MLNAQEFYTAFQTFRSELSSRLDSNLNPSAEFLHRVAQDLQLERKKINDATSMDILPAYDRRIYESQLQELETRLKSLQTQASSSKGKFAFKKRDRTAIATPRSKPEQRNESIPDIPDNSVKPLSNDLVNDTLHEATTSANLTASSTSDITFGPATSSFLTTSSIPRETSDGLTLTISSLSHCIIDLLGSHDNTSLGVVRAVHIQDVKDTLIILGNVRGSVLAHNLTNCIVVVACHQLRIHTSHDTHFLIHVSSNAIIEDCDRLGFGGYPKSPPFPPLPKAVCDQKSMHNEIQDFSHLKSTPSPHWSSLSDSEPDYFDWTDVLEKLGQLHSSQEERNEDEKSKQLSTLLSTILPKNN